MWMDSFFLSFLLFFFVISLDRGAGQEERAAAFIDHCLKCRGFVW